MRLRLRSPVVISWLSTAALVAMAMPILWFYGDRLSRQLIETANEGWNALFIERAMSGGTLYPGTDEMLFNNYPPLSFYIVGVVGWLTGDVVLAGRLVSFAAYLAVAVLVGVIVRGRTGSWGAGGFAAPFFLVLFASFPGGRIGLNDPQLLAHALMMSGLALVWLRPGRVGAVVGAAGLMAIAGLTKHNIIAVPFAVTAWMWWRGRRPFAIWMGAGVGAGLVALGGLMLFWGVPALRSIVSARTFSMGQMASALRRLMALTEVPLACWAVGVMVGPRSSDSVLATLLVVGSGVEVLLFAGGAGVGANVGFDLVISLSVGLGLVLGRLESPVAVTAVLALQLFHLSLVIPFEPLRVLVGQRSGKAEEEAALTADIAYLRQHPGPALCLDMVLCWYAGRAVVYDRFNMGQQFALRLRSPEPLEALLRERRYSVVEVDKDKAGAMGLPAPALAMLEQNYVMDRRSEDREFFVPR